MRSVIKTMPKTVHAWQLGDNSSMEQKLIREGLIRRLPSGQYELFSSEISGEKGQIACYGDYFKVDSSGFPYPNSRDFFDSNHVWIRGDEYRQIPQKLQAWFLGDPVDAQILFLLKHKGLQVSPEQPDACFSAPLWGSVLTAAADAALLIYETKRDQSGEIIDMDFNFVSRAEFEKTYQFL